MGKYKTNNITDKQLQTLHERFRSNSKLVGETTKLFHVANYRDVNNIISTLGDGTGLADQWLQGTVRGVWHDVPMLTLDEIKSAVVLLDPAISDEPSIPYMIEVTVELKYAGLSGDTTNTHTIMLGVPTVSQLFHLPTYLSLVNYNSGNRDTFIGKKHSLGELGPHIRYSDEEALLYNVYIDDETGAKRTRSLPLTRDGSTIVSMIDCLCAFGVITDEERASTDS